jgi:hypothetical protein
LFIGNYSNITPRKVLENRRSAQGLIKTTTSVLAQSEKVLKHEYESIVETSFSQDSNGAAEQLSKP